MFDKNDDYVVLKLEEVSALRAWSSSVSPLLTWTVTTTFIRARSVASAPVNHVVIDFG